MGREIKRVAPDFQWTPRKVWKGYINPHYKPCPASPGACQGGQTLAGAWLDSICRFIALVGEQALGPASSRRIYPHPYLRNFCTAPTTEGVFDTSSDDVREHRMLKAPEVLPPSREMYDLVAKLCEQDDPPGLGGMDDYKLREKLLKLGEADDSWGICPVCKGEAIDPEAKEAYEAWQSYEPPPGDGWQVWETVSEGSPVSPVFSTPEALIEWLCQPEGSDERWTKRGVYGDGSPSCYSEQGQNREAAESFVRAGWVPSALGSDGVLLSGIACAGRL